MAGATAAPGDAPKPQAEAITPAQASEEASKPPIKSEGTSKNPNSKVTEAQWSSMHELLNTLYDHRTLDGHDPSAVFHRKVNKRVLPDYYDVIKEPMALSMIKAKLGKQEYNEFHEYVRDLALMCHNAQVYNRPDAGAYQDALEIKRVVEEELSKLVENSTVTAEAAKLPEFGEIPPPEELPPPEYEEEEEEEVGTSDEENDDDDLQAPRKRGRPSKADVAKREALRAARKSLGIDDEAEAQKRRGRPPKVDTPMDARLKNILKGMRRPKNSAGQYLISHFDRLPDRTQLPAYYIAIKNPIAMDQIKKKMKRKKYKTVEEFVADTNLMFENAKVFNEDHSEIYNDTVALQAETLALAEAEKQRPDTDFASEDGRIPMPDGVIYRGELYRVGDWVHLTNPNDLTKPIPSQIYRTFQDQSGSSFINACWYYRPEQTVHRFDKHFFENEVVKTGQYRDHAVEDIVGRCFIMFITRYSRGRPRAFPPDKDLYVCESRYNEEKHTFNKIKTWASCLPDEVRDRDYEMDLYVEPKRMVKLPSPIAYLAKNVNQETAEENPKPQWGSENAPPKIGAIHFRPRDPKDSPPPEPAPTPAHVASLPTKMATPSHAPLPVASTPRQPVNMSAVNMSPATQHSVQYPPRLPNQHALNAASRGQHTSTPQMPPQPRAPPSSAYPTHPPSTAPVPRLPAQPAPTPSPAYPRPASTTYNTSRPPYQQPYNYTAPQPIEVWTLNPAGDAAIPDAIRRQFQRDAAGHVLFFTAPPLVVSPPAPPGLPLGHSARYLAAKLKRDALLSAKRARDADAQAEAQRTDKKRRVHEAVAFEHEVERLRERALRVWEGELRAEVGRAVAP